MNFKLLTEKDRVYNGDWCAAEGSFTKIDWIDESGEEEPVFAIKDGNIYFREFEDQSLKIERLHKGMRGYPPILPKKLHRRIATFYLFNEIVKICKDLSDQLMTLKDI